MNTKINESQEAVQGAQDVLAGLPSAPCAVLRVKYLTEAIANVKKHLECEECGGEVEPRKDCENCDGEGQWYHEDCDDCEGHDCEECEADGFVGDHCAECGAAAPMAVVNIGPAKIGVTTLELALAGHRSNSKASIYWYLSETNSLRVDIVVGGKRKQLQ